MRYTYFLSIVEHRLPGPEPEELCSVLLDVLEEGDWKSVPLDAPEPILTHVAPDLVDHVTDALLVAGYQVVRHEDATCRRIDRTHLRATGSGGAEKLKITAVPRVPGAKGLTAAEQCNASDSDLRRRGGIVITVDRSALSLFVGCPRVGIARAWIENAARASGLRVEVRD